MADLRSPETPRQEPRRHADRAYPHRPTVAMTCKMRDEIIALALRMDATRPEVARRAIEEGLPVLRRRLARAEKRREEAERRAADAAEQRRVINSLRQEPLIDAEDAPKILRELGMESDEE